MIYTLMKERAAEFPEDERPELLEAASSWRLPYWDVAMKKPDSAGNRDYNVPLVFRDKEVEIRLPVTLLPPPGVHAQQPNFPNALYQFTMPGNKRMGDDSLGRLKIRDVEDEDDDRVPVTLPVSLPPSPKMLNERERKPVNTGLVWPLHNNEQAAYCENFRCVG